ncbi:MAG TPA: M56 family metallopeptidase [Longimicrobium sp.]|nr:M56 family metallopeptidase [Longimicrobium sp.]
MTNLLDSAMVAGVLDTAIRGTLILLAALGGTALMKRSSASARHLVWLAALAAILMLPLARRFVPEWRVVPVPTAARIVLLPTPAPATEAAPAPVVSAPIATNAPETTTAPAPAPASAPVDWRAVALLLWAAGAALFFARLLYGLVRVQWIERRAVELTDDRWVRLTDGLARRLRLGRIVRLLREPGATVPMTWGVFRPVILLPGEADSWDEERRRVVLAHELAHVRRWDALTQWIAHVAVAVYWFNPLVWIAARKLREEREHACDDAVLEAGARPTEYADHLLTIVRSLGMAGGRPVAALAMARRSQFEGRLLAILDSAVRRNGVSRAAALATAAAALACVLPLAALQAVEPADGLTLTAQVVKSPAGADGDGVAKAGTVARQAQEIAKQALLPEPGAPIAPLVAVAPLEARQPMDPRTAAEAQALSRTAAAGNDDQTKRAALGAVAQQDPALYAEIIKAAEEIDSDSDRRLVLCELLRRPDLSRANLHAIIGATRTMQSDTERRIVLGETLGHAGMRGGDLPAELFESLSKFASATEQRIVMSTIIERPRVSQGELLSLFRFVPRMESDTEKRLVLTTAAQRHRIEGAARDAYLAAARSMTSDTERGLTLSTLVGQGGRAAAEPTRQAAPVAGEPTRPRLAVSASGTSDRAGQGESLWSSDIDYESNGRRLFIDAKKVVFGNGRWDVRRIERGGRLIVEERRRDGTVCRVEAVPGRDGRPVWTYKRNGVVQSYDSAERTWFENLVREITT